MELSEGQLQATQVEATRFQKLVAERDGQLIKQYADLDASLAREADLKAQVDAMKEEMSELNRQLGNELQSTLNAIGAGNVARSEATSSGLSATWAGPARVRALPAPALPLAPPPAPELQVSLQPLRHDRIRSVHSNEAGSAGASVLSDVSGAGVSLTSPQGEVQRIMRLYPTSGQHVAQAGPIVSDRPPLSPGPARPGPPVFPATVVSQVAPAVRLPPGSPGGVVNTMVLQAPQPFRESPRRAAHTPTTPGAAVLSQVSSVATTTTPIPSMEGRSVAPHPAQGQAEPRVIYPAAARGQAQLQAHYNQHYTTAGRFSPAPSFYSR